MSITLKQLRHAQALAKFGNFRRAAASQNLTQPAFSRSIQMLETSLGAPLFDRLTDGVAVTVYGKALLQRAETVLLETQELEREIQLLKGLDGGDFWLTMGIYSADVAGNRAIAALAEQHPHLRCHISVTDWRSVTDQVISQRADIGFAEISVAREDPRLQVVPTQPHAVVLFVRSGHPLSDATSLSKSDLDTFPLATVRLPPRVANLFPGITDADGETGALIPSLELDNMDTMRTVVLESDAFGMAAPVQIDRPAQQGDFVMLPYREPWMHLDHGLIFLRNRTLSPSAERFMELAISIEKQVARENEALMQRYFASG